MAVRRSFVGWLACVMIGLTYAQPAAALTLPATLDELAGLINQYRAARGLASVTLSPALTSSAQWMASSMAANNYFSHTSIDGRSPFQRMADVGYPTTATWTGEDIAAGYANSSAVLVAWQNSPAHNDVLLNPNYRVIGLGLAYSSSSTYGWYWVADFGGIVDGVRALPPDSGYHGTWALQSAWPTLSSGQVATLVIAFTNTGSRPWVRGVAGQQANLGTAAPLDRRYPDLQWSWPSDNRLALQTTDYVLPGQLGWFSFTVRAPSAPGAYTLAVRPVIDGTTWLEDSGAYWLITVR